MKKIFLIILLTLSANISHAQFEITSTGIVNINNPESSSAIVNVQGKTNNIRCVRKGNLFSGTNPVVEGMNYATGAELAIGVRGACFSTNGSTNCGVYGISTQGGANKNFGVMGLLYSPSAKGAGIFGSSNYVNLTIPTFTSNYAGYFDGNVHIQGNVTYSGSITGNVVLTAAPQPSAVQEESTSSLNANGVPASNLLQTLDLQTYTHNPLNNIRKSSSKVDMSGSDSTEAAFLQAIEDAEVQDDVIGEQILSKQHYGLDADQLEEIFPDLVYENEDGTKSINYVEMVPILVQAVKELKAEIATLKSNGPVKKASKRTATGIADGTMQTAALGQNRPNPATATTAIDVTVPAAIERAALCIYDLNGKKLQQHDIMGRGKQTIQLNASTLADGIYLYSLIADGKVIQTRRMVIEK